MKQVLPGTIEYAIHTACDNQKPRLLLHACCGPCATSVLEYLTPHFDVTVFFYNPNIMPKDEFIKRETTLKTVIEHFDGVKLISPEQDESEYIPLVAGHEQDAEGGERCSICFALRLGKRRNILPLTKINLTFCNHAHRISAQERAPYQQDRRRDCGKIRCHVSRIRLQKRNGYLRSIQLCKEWGIYRQNYCGCRLNASL